jgi:fructose-1-phosphate kinase PfkB-like protein
MAAGIAWALRQGRNMIEAVRFGVACGADNAMDLFPARLRPERIERLLGQVGVSRVGG